MSESLFVTIQEMGAEARTIPWEGGRTAAWYLEQAEIVLKSGRIVNVNGETVNPETYSPNPGDVLTIAKPVANG